MIKSSKTKQNVVFLALEIIVAVITLGWVLVQALSFGIISFPKP